MNTAKIAKSKSEVPHKAKRKRTPKQSYTAADAIKAINRRLAKKKG